MSFGAITGAYVATFSTRRSMNRRTNTATMSRRRTVHAESEEYATRPIVMRLNNWGRCLKHYVPGWTSTQPIGGDSGSAERRFRAEDHSGYRTVNPDTTFDLDPHDAKLIEAAVGVLPLYYHTLLKAWYVRRLEPGKCLAVAAKVAVPVRKRIPFDAFDGELEAAYVLLLDALELPAVIRKQRAKDLVRERLA
jgi:hypothetical protein